VSLWDIIERRKVADFSGGTTSVALHPSGRWLALAGLGEAIIVWEVETRQRVFELRGHLDRVASVAYSPDGRWLASGGEAWTIRLWDAAARASAAGRGLARPS